MDEHLAAARDRRQRALGQLKRPLRNFGSAHLVCGLLLGACEIAIFAKLSGPEQVPSRQLHQLVIFLSPVFILTGLLSLAVYFTPPISLRRLGILSVVAAAAALCCSIIGISVVSNSLQGHANVISTKSSSVTASQSLQDSNDNFSVTMHAIEAALLAVETLASIGHLTLGCRQFCCRELHPIGKADMEPAEDGAETALAMGVARSASRDSRLSPYYEQSNQSFRDMAREIEAGPDRV
ncbi:hypothetical protein BOX15_Mlig007761g6 [Macrostomum lignano]|uniref:Uncharacterized protein n=2 Tax=Macrostomum lignano TaxID=282301 RepID=A0A267FQV9_9PLAT|nr:hypothetical protein BOX15_Mlig007761g6 [Macrostomum lignano]